jgi:hypothetical protein
MKTNDVKSDLRQHSEVTWYRFLKYFFFFSVPVCAITASGVPGGTLVSMNRSSTLCGWLVQRQGWRMKGEYDRVSRRDRLGLTPDLATRDLWRSRRWAKERGKILSIHPCGTSRVLLQAVNLTICDLPALLHIREEGVLRIFIDLKNPSPWPGFEPATFGSSGQHTNHYTTTKATFKYF